MPSTTSVEDFITSFPYQDILKITGEPNYEALKELRTQLKANAASIETARGGGNHGHLGLVVSDAIYNIIAPGTPYQLPNNPGCLPNIPAGATAAQIAEIVRQHTANSKEYNEYVNLHNALKKQLIQAIESIYLRAIRDPHSQFLNATLREMLAHLFNQYGDITDQDLADNENKIKQAWNPAEPFDALVQQIDECQEYADDAGAPFTDRQILSTAYNIVFNTGLFFDDCRKWIARPMVDKTWDNFKTHFRSAAKLLRLQQKTSSQQAGFHGANNTIHQDTAEALANLATAANADRQVLSTLTNTVADLNKKINEKDAEISALKKKLTGRYNSNNTPNTSKYCYTHGSSEHGDF